MPVRVQRKRTKGWKMPLNCVYVGRPTIWGNPFAVSKTIPLNKCLRIYRAWLSGTFTERAIERIVGKGVKCPAQPLSIFQYLLWRGTLRNRISELRGKDLACWCPLISHGNYVPCHADVLLSIANDIPLEDVIRENTRRAKGETL